MIIGIDISQSQYLGTGVGTYTKNLVTHLVDLASDHKFVLFGGSIRNYYLLKQQFTNLPVSKRIFPLPPSWLDRLFNQYQQLPIELFTGRIDIFHASDWTQPRSRSAGLVTTVHDLTTIKFPQFHDPVTVTTHQRRLQLIKKLAVHVIADSQATKKDLVSYLNLPESQISVVYLAPSQIYKNFAQLPRNERIEQIRSIKSKYQLKKYLLFVGTQEPRKNLDKTLDAFSLLANQYPQLELILVGKFGWGTTLSEKLNGLGKVRSLGLVQEEDLPGLYAGSSGFVYPSLYEGFGLPVVEAMQSGTPVVTSNKGSLAEVAGKAAMMVNPRSASDIARGIIEILNFPSHFSKLGTKQAEKFNWQNTAQQTLDVYQQIYSIQKQGI